MSLWLWEMASLIAMSSLLRVYMGAVKYSQVTRGDLWILDGDPIIHRVIVALKKKYGLPNKRQKLALSLGMILDLARQLKGFPVLEALSHNDRLWLFASVMGCLGLLRGGEFLVSPGRRQKRPVLMAADLGMVQVTAANRALGSRSASQRPGSGSHVCPFPS